MDSFSKEVLGVPDNAAAVAANALVDQLGKFELSPLGAGADGLVET
jgi:hypothetical protein